ncbi:hypothetical protein GCM10010129_67680 [Streptomyces fumigatiscleroticus]|nr:hypothetical protein GCM10010129_67680 [Streptomyces fumigatiscleroticus]
MTQGWKITVLALAAAGVVSTPFVWLLNGPEAGEMAGASIQAAVGVAALVWALYQSPDRDTGDTAVRTGRARAVNGGEANSGIRLRRTRGARWSSRVENTGEATAHGAGSKANSGIE